MIYIGGAIDVGRRTLSSENPQWAPFIVRVTASSGEAINNKIF